MATLWRGDLPRILTPAMAGTMGITRSRTRTEIHHGSWRPLGRGLVLTRPDPPTREDWIEAALCVAGRSAAVSGSDALRARGIIERRQQFDPPLVLVRIGRSRAIGPVAIRRTDRPFQVTTTSAFAGFLPFTPIVGVARAAADAALQAQDRMGVRALVAAAVQRGRCDVSELVHELEAGPRRGSVFLRLALAEIGAGARSAAEADALRRLEGADLPPFELNVRILDQHGVHLFTVDAFWRELRAALEIDSREYHFSDRDWQRTLRRHNVLTAAGLSVVHFAPSAVAAAGWLAEVSGWLQRRAVELDRPWRPRRGWGLTASPAAPAPFVIAT